MLQENYTAYGVSENIEMICFETGDVTIYIKHILGLFMIFERFNNDWLSCASASIKISPKNNKT